MFRSGKMIHLQSGGQNKKPLGLGTLVGNGREVGQRACAWLNKLRSVHGALHTTLALAMMAEQLEETKTWFK